MSIQDTIASLERNTRMGTSRSLMAHGGQAGNSTVLEGVYQERGHIPPHYHDCEEVILCAQGEGILFIGEEPHTFMAGATMVIPAGVAHCVYNTGIGQLRLLAFFPSACPAFHWVASLRRMAETGAAA